MSTPRKFYLLILSGMLALAAGLAFTGPAYAQEGAPQPPAAVGDETLTPPPPPPPGDSLAGLSGGDDLSTPLLPPPPPDLSSMTSGLAASGVTLMDEEDHPLPVISQSLADGAFPWIRVGTTIHYFATDCSGLTGNCHQDPNPVQGAVEYIIAYGILPTDRAIHIDGSPDQHDGAVSINGTTNAILKQLNRLEGGCNRGTGLCDGSDPAQTVLNKSLSVSGTLAGFTLQGLTIKGGVTFTGNAGALTVRNVVIEGGTEGGLNVTGQSGPVTIEGVRVVNAPNTGIFINNSAAIAPVTITGSTADGAGSLAGEIIAKGPVTIISSVFHYGRMGGLKITTMAPLTVRNSLFKDNASSGSNDAWDGTGLHATASSILLDFVQTTHNARNGFLLNATWAITVLNSRSEYNGLVGLMICKDGDCRSSLPAAGPVTLAGSDFLHNGNAGALISNIGTVNITSTSFCANTWHGLGVNNAGPVLFNGIIAMGNGGTGVWLDQCRYDSVLGRCTSGAGLTVLNTAGSNSFFNNQTNGLWVHTGGAIVLNGVFASENTDGVVLINHETLAAPGVTINGMHSGNNRIRGVDITSRGVVTWTNGGAGDNGRDATSGSGQGGGAYIDNTPGFAPVSLTNLYFSNNQEGDGLHVDSARAITLTQVEAGGNGAIGVSLNNAGTGAVGGINVTASVDKRSWLGGNGANGLFIHTRGAVLLSNLNVSDNGQVGALIDNSLAPVYLPVTVINLNANNNGAGGIKVTSRGAITITNIDAGQNNGMGAWLDNTAGAGPVTIIRTFAGHNWFGNNKGIGLFIRARGQIMLNRIAADNVRAGTIDGVDYQGYGAEVDNCLWEAPAGKCLGAGGVTLNGTPGWDNNFNRNAGVGLHIQSGGAIAVFNLQVRENGLDGVLIDNNWGQPPFSATLATVGNSMNNIERNGRYGLRIASSGAITLRNVQVIENNGPGADLYNKEALTPQPILVENGVFNNNQNGNGLSARSKGPVTLVGIEAQNNDMHETSLEVDTRIDNRVQMTGEANADVFHFTQDTQAHTFILTPDFNATLRLQRWDADTSTWQLVKEVPWSSTMTLTETFLSGVEYRLLVIGNDLSTGNTYRLAHDSDGFIKYAGAGVYVNTNDAHANGPVKIIGLSPNYSSFSGNASDGIVINARGAVSLSRVAIENNAGHGAYVDNCLWNSSANACSVAAGVFVNGVNNAFNANRRHGLVILSGNTINLDNIDAWRNGEGGVYLDNRSGLAGVMIQSSHPTQSNSISQNGGIGLAIQSRGAILINDTDASGNSGSGGLLNNESGAGSVTVNNSAFNNNGNDGTQQGLSIDSSGAIALNGVSANDNQGCGVSIGNRNAAIAQPVTILHSQFNFNRGAMGNGLTVLSKGAITLNNVEAVSNELTGALLDNCLSTAPNVCNANVAVNLLSTLGVNLFYHNGDNGLAVYSNGNILATRLLAGYNGRNHVTEGSGAILSSNNGSVVVSDGLFEHNWRNGLSVNARAGDITLTGTRCISNSFDVTPPAPDLDTLAGAMLHAGKNVRVINSNFNGNAEYGLRYHKGDGFSYTWVGSFAVSNNDENVGASNIQAF